MCKTKLSKTLFCFIGAIAMAACASMQNYSNVLHSWRGASINELMSVWGYPNYIQRLANGNRLYIYRDTNRGRYPVYTAPSYSTMTSRRGKTISTTVPTTATGGGIYDLRCTTWFEVNRRNKIVGMSFRGNDCIATRKFVEMKSRPARKLPSPRK